MQIAPMAGFMETVVITWMFIFSGVGVPMGVPPLPEDPATANVAPENCLAYFSSYGMDEADPDSSNQTERLFAEPEVRSMAAEIERAVRRGFQKAGEKGKLPPSLPADDLVDMVKILLTRPSAAYVSEVQMHPGGPIVRGGLAVNCGDDAAKVRAVLERAFKDMPPQIAREIQIDGEKWTSFKAAPNTTIVWGFKGNRLLAAAGEGEIEAMQLRAKGPAPKWLQKLHENLLVERVATVAYFNAKAILRLALPAAGPQAAKFVEVLGFGNVEALETVAGLDEKGFVAKSLWRIDGEPQGVFRLANAAPLTPDDLALVPADATCAAALKLDPAGFFDLIRQTVERIDPNAKAVMDAQIAQTEMMLGLKLRQDVLEPLGDTWCLFDSPGEGGAISGLTLVSRLKDPRRAVAAHEKLIQISMAMLNARRPQEEDVEIADFFSAGGTTRLYATEFKGRKIYIFDGGMFGPPCTPAWCFTDKELVASLNPQGVKGYLSRGGDFKSLAQVPEVAELFADGAGPLRFAYCNTQRMFDVFYPIALIYGKYAMSALRMSGVELDVSIFPSAQAIRPHIRPSVVSSRRIPLGIEIVERRTMPGPSVSTALPAAVAALLPAVQSARQAARMTHSKNNVKQIGLAMLNYAAANRAFPPAYTVDKDGKPLLSWRVLILPYLESNNLITEFHLDEPWDSEHNKKLIEKMPECYKSPTSKVADQGKTNYLTVRGERTIFPGKDPTGFAQIRDGTSNTIMTVEVSDDKAVIWTKPDDFEYDEKDPIKGLIGLWPDGFHAGLADGSVFFIRSSIDRKVLRLLFIRDDGEFIPDDAVD
ncbi:MAG: DUF1559 domain-containing protein [Pirellulales bacterium]|nr:DUF1559 domain-containing protein [Pirellulales bacterium]